MCKSLKSDLKILIEMEVTLVNGYNSKNIYFSTFFFFKDHKINNTTIL